MKDLLVTDKPPHQEIMAELPSVRTALTPTLGGGSDDSGGLRLGPDSTCQDELLTTVHSLKGLTSN